MAIDREDTLKKAEQLLRQGKLDAAIAESVKVVEEPHDQESRLALARSAVLSGDFDGARAFLDRATAGNDPTLQMALLEMELRSGELDEARELLRTLLAMGAEQRDRVTELAWATAVTNPETAFVVIDAVVDAADAAGDFGVAAALLREFAARVPNQIPALLKLVEVCVDGGLEATMFEAQAQLADAYLGVGQAAEARVIAEDLVAREPWERAHIDRFRRALMVLKVSDPDSLIAARLSGGVPASSEEDSLALLYDLGTMLEERGDTARALAVFLELQSEAGDCRDVAERVERLARVEAGG